MTDSAETRWESHNEAGRRAFRQGDHSAAEQEFIAAIREANSLGSDDARLASSLAGLAQIKYLQRDFEQAEALFKRALAIRERTLGEKHPEVAATLNSLARLYFHRNEHLAAAPLLMRLLSIKQEALGAHHPEVAVILTSLAKVRLAERQYEDAEQLARRALLIREGIHDSNDPAVAMSLDTLADVLAARGMLEEEQGLRKRIAQIRGSSAPPERQHDAVDQTGGTKATRPGSGAQAAAPSRAPEPARTTRTASLPWIEPPTSPALRRPVPRPFTTTGQLPSAGGSAGASRPAASGTRTTTPPPTNRNTPRFSAAYAPPAGRPADHSLARPLGEAVTGPVRGPLLQQGAATSGDQREVQRDGHRQRTRTRGPAARSAPRSRPLVKVVIGALVVLGGAGGAWVYLSQTRVTASAGAALDAPALEGGSSADPSAGSQPSTAAPRGEPTFEQPVRQGPPKGAYSDDPPVNVDESPLPATGFADSASNRAAEQANDPAAEAGRGATRTTPAVPTRPESAPAASAPVAAPGSTDSSARAGTSAPSIPSVNVDRITEAIGENARAKADSLGKKTISVKPPVFEKP